MSREPEQRQTPATPTTADRVILGAMVLLPLVAAALVAYNFVVVSTPDLCPTWAAIPVGVLVGIVVVVIAILLSGRDGMDVMVQSGIIILLMLLLLPVCPRMKAQRLRRKRPPAPPKSSRLVAPHLRHPRA